MTSVVWIGGLALLVVACGLAIWAYDPAYRLAYRAKLQCERDGDDPRLEGQAVSEPPSR